MQRQLIICLGPVCSGKTTWSKQFIRDNLHSFRFCFDEYLHMCKNDGEFDTEVVDSAPSAIGSLIMRGSVVVDGFPLDFKCLKRIINFRYNANASVTIRLFDVKLDDAIKRSVHRAKVTGRLVKVSEIQRYTERYKEFLSSDEFEILSENIEVIANDFCNVNRSLVL